MVLRRTGLIRFTGSPAPIDTREGGGNVSSNRNVQERLGMHVDYVDCDRGISALQAVGKKAMPDNSDHFFV